MKHDELQEDLARHLRGSTDRMVWTNLQLGPSGSPRPDVTTIAKSYSKFQADCYEIKVSMSDLRSDVTSGKWQSYRRYCNRMWFAFPKAMAPLDLIPKECGVICRSKESGLWRAVRKPVAQVLDTLPRDAWLKLLIESNPDAAAHARQRPSANYWKGEELVRQKMGAEIGALFRSAHDAETMLKHRISTANAQRQAMEDRLEQERKWRDEAARRAESNLSDALESLADTLGLPKDMRTPGKLAAALHDAQRRLSGRGIDDAIKLLQGLRGAVLPEGASA